MIQSKSFVTLLVLAAAGLMLVGSSQNVISQEAKPAAKAEAKKAPSKARGYLPPYFKEVVTKQQTEKIYAIQATYDEQIETLAKQVKELQAKRLAEMKAVLTPEQLKLVDEFAAAAKAKAQAVKAAQPTAAPVKATEATASAPAKAAIPAATPKKP